VSRHACGHNVTYKEPTHSHTLARALFVQTEGNRSPRALLLPLIPKYKPAAAAAATASLALTFARGNVGACYVHSVLPVHYLSSSSMNKKGAAYYGYFLGSEAAARTAARTPSCLIK
jgi:hypothetical protein